MLELKNITKSYTTGDFTQQALKDVSLKFRQSEFVAVLGPSGSGKTTLLNIVGGLDRYDRGDLIINGKSTKDFKDRAWDAYRNNCVGFVFQSYNLIGHISVLGNVEMSMTLSGVSASERKEKSLKALERVGLKDHVHKKPNQLSGGQMQRVAIARALVNDPDIILADEPTGALDTKTSKQIMELINEIAKDKLVIMVTHNPELAQSYANRIVDMRDGEVLEDSNPVEKIDKARNFNIKKTSMSFLTALKLSFNNIKTKKGRTLLTAFASSIGIIGIALILSLSNGFDIQIKKFEKESLSSLPIMITQQAMSLDEDTLNAMKEEENALQDYPTGKVIYSQEDMENTVTHSNPLDKEYIEYIKNMNQDLVSGISYTNLTNLNILIKNTAGEYTVANPMIFGHIPEKNDKKNQFEFMDDTYDLLAGNYPTNKEELVLIVDSKNRVSKTILEALGLDGEDDSYTFDALLGLELKLVPNNLYYKSYEYVYGINTDFEAMYNSNEAITLKIGGIVRGKEDKAFISSFSSGVGYSQELVDYIVDINKDSEIVKAQAGVNYNIMTSELFTDEEIKDQTLAYLGAESVPYYIQIFSKDFDSKDKILEYLDTYNEGKATEEQILYTDAGAMLASLSGNIMNGITVVLIAFSAISLVVSTIMIAIITYISVLERTKEIGILRALGARKKDISRVFNAETFIIGLFSGLLGIGIAELLTIPANILIENFTSLKNVAVLNPVHAMVLITISIVLTLLGGAIPARMASKKDPVIALRSE